MLVQDKSHLYHFVEVEISDSIYLQNNEPQNMNKFWNVNDDSSRNSSSLFTVEFSLFPFNNRTFNYNL